MVKAVEALSRGRSFLTLTVAEWVLQSSPNGVSTVDPVSGSPLTAREREVIQLLAEGRSNKEVADILGISVRTAETHRTNVMRKLNCHSMSDLVRYAIRNHIITA